MLLLCSSAQSWQGILLATLGQWAGMLAGSLQLRRSIAQHPVSSFQGLHRNGARDLSAAGGFGNMRLRHVASPRHLRHRMAYRERPWGWLIGLKAS